jgi:hypothetical protein
MVDVYHDNKEERLYVTSQVVGRFRVDRVVTDGNPFFVAETSQVHTGPHTTPFAWCTSILKDFSFPRRISPPSLPRFQSRRTPLDASRLRFRRPRTPPGSQVLDQVPGDDEGARALAEEEADVWRLLKQLERLSAKTDEGDGAQIDYDMRRCSVRPLQKYDPGSSRGRRAPRLEDVLVPSFVRRASLRPFASLSTCTCTTGAKTFD